MRLKHGKSSNRPTENNIYTIPRCMFYVYTAYCISYIINKNAGL